MPPRRKQKASSTNPPVPPANNTPSTPDWPPLTPPPHASLQTITTVLPSQILTLPLLTPAVSAHYRHFLSTLPLTTTPPPTRRDHAARVNDRFQTTDRAFAHHLWTATNLSTILLSSCAAATLGGEPLGLSDRIRVYRYAPGQFFAPHYDEAGAVDFVREDGAVVPGRTAWTLLVYLSGPATGCEGGETAFYPERSGGRGARPEPVVVGLEVGMALLHRHGKECLLHEGREVVRGEKWVIRSDLVVRR